MRCFREYYFHAIKKPNKEQCMSHRGLKLLGTLAKWF